MKSSREVAGFLGLTGCWDETAVSISSTHFFDLTEPHGSRYDMIRMVEEDKINLPDLLIVLLKHK
jgi:hypothetical protein